jgi:DNA polymerase III delta subunit
MYQKFKKNLQETSNKVAKNIKTKIIYLYGNNQFFIDKSLEKIKKIFLEQEIEIKKFNPKKSYLNFKDFSSQSSIFEEHSAFIIDCTEMEKSFLQNLKRDNPKIINKTIILVDQTSKSATSFISYLKKYDNLSLCCQEIKPSDHKLFIKDICQKYLLALDKGALIDLSEQLGSANLYQIENEINKLSLIFCKQKSALTSIDINKHLGLINTEHVFELKNHLLENNHSKAHSMIIALLAEGGNSLALLGILSFFCRQCLTIKSFDNLPPHTIAQKTRIPKFVIGKYLNYTNKMRTKNLEQAFDLCSQADIILKTNSKTRDSIILSEIINYL